MTATLLTRAQIRQIQAAAALLRVSDREKFLHDVAAWLGRHPIDDEVTAAVAAVLGVRPHETHLGEVPPAEGARHGQDSPTQRR